MLKLLLRLIKSLIIYTLIIVLSVIIRQYIGFNVVDGESMQPLLSDGGQSTGAAGNLPGQNYD